MVKSQSAQFFSEGRQPSQWSLWSLVSLKREETALLPPTSNPEIISIPPLRAEVSAWERLAAVTSSWACVYITLLQYITDVYTRV